MGHHEWVNPEPPKARGGYLVPQVDVRHKAGRVPAFYRWLWRLTKIPALYRWGTETWYPGALLDWYKPDIKPGAEGE